jgi:hypothetical protein
MGASENVQNPFVLCRFVQQEVEMMVNTKGAGFDLALLISLNCNQVQKLVP